MCATACTHTPLDRFGAKAFHGSNTLYIRVCSCSYSKLPLPRLATETVVALMKMAPPEGLNMLLGFLDNRDTHFKEGLDIIERTFTGTEPSDAIVNISNEEIKARFDAR